MKKFLSIIALLLLSLSGYAQIGGGGFGGGGTGGGASFPATPGVVCNSSTTASHNCTNTELATPLGLDTTTTTGNIVSYSNTTGAQTDSGLSVTGLASLGAALVPGFQAAWFPYINGSGTALTDLSGNGYTATFDTLTHAPAFNAAGNAIIFNPTATFQDIQFPAAAILGAQCVELWFDAYMPSQNDGSGTALSFLISDSAGKGIGFQKSQFGQVSLVSGANTNAVATDRIINNGSIFMSIPNAGSSIHYPNGHGASGYLSQGTLTFNAASGNGHIGDYAPGGSNFGFSGLFYGAVIRNTACTAAQVQQDDVYVKSQLAQRGVTSFAESKYPYLMIYNGDSIFANYPTLYLGSSQPYQISLLNGKDQFYNWGITGQTQSTINGALASREYPILAQNATASKSVMSNAGTNDINGGATAATVKASLDSYATSIHSNFPGTRVTEVTAMPRNNNTNAQEAQREALIALQYADYAAGTLVAEGLADWANDPIASTQITPNSYFPTAAPSTNVTWFADGIHPTPAMQAILASTSAAAILAAEGKLNKPFWIHKEIPFQVPAVFTGLTQTINILQLGKNWQVCGIKSTVTTAFAGMATLGYSIGDSTGTATQYMTSQSLLATGSVMSQANTFVSNSGIVQATFTGVSTLNTTSAGYINLDVCVVTLK